MLMCRACLSVFALALLAASTQPARAAEQKSRDSQAYWDPQALEQKDKAGTYQISCPGLPGAVWNAVAVPMGGATPTRSRLTYRVGGEKEGQPMVPHPNEAVGFTVQAPAKIEPYESLGVVVYISPGQAATVGNPFAGYCNDHRLVCISANMAGNQALPAWRSACAVSAVELVRRRYKVDAKRVYVCGVSGGGRVTSYVMLRHSDIFGGACPIIGCNGPELWLKASHIPPASMGQFCANTRLVILEGEKDFNRADSKKLYDEWYKRKVRHAVYIEQPGLAHALPGAAYLLQTLDYWDQPVIAAAARKWPSVQKDLADPKRRARQLDALIAMRPAMHDKAWGADALKAYQALAVEFKAAQKAVEDSIGAGDFKAAQQGLNPLKSDWGDVGRDAAKVLAESVRQAQNEARKAGK